MTTFRNLLENKTEIGYIKSTCLCNSARGLEQKKCEKFEKMYHGNKELTNSYSYLKISIKGKVVAKNKYKLSNEH